MKLYVLTIVSIIVSGVLCQAGCKLVDWLQDDVQPAGFLWAIIFFFCAAVAVISAIAFVLFCGCGLYLLYVAFVGV